MLNFEKKTIDVKDPGMLIICHWFVHVLTGTLNSLLHVQNLQSTFVLTLYLGSSEQNMNIKITTFRTE